MARPVALVTGASSGIGMAFARLLAEKGHDLVLVARRKPELTALAAELKTATGAESTIIVADLSKPTAVPKIVKALEDRPIDVLINNAGFGGHGSFVDRDPDEERRMIAVNITAVTDLAKAFVPAMVARGSGRVLNVASTAAFQPGPFMAVYYATKAYVLSFTEALAEELSGTGVTATALCPGVVPSGFQQAAQLSGDQPLLKSPGAKSPEEVAQAAYRGMMKGRRIVIPGAINKVGVQSIRVSPRRVVTKVVRRLQPV